MAVRSKGASSKLLRWTTLRKTIQILALLAFLTLFVASRRGGWPTNLVNAPMRLDPLTVLAHLFASRIFLTSSLLALFTILLTLVFGKVWCGWLCPLGTILDWIPFIRARSAPKGSRPGAQPPEGWRRIKYGLLLVILFAALFTNLTLLVFDPLTILFRTLSTSVWPALDQIIVAVEAALYQGIPLPGGLQSSLRNAVSAFDGWLRPEVLPLTPAFYRATLLYAGLFTGIILLNLFATRFWCRYLCPLGALLGLLSKFAVIRRKVGPECKGCTLCTRACPTGTIQPDKGYASDPSECTVCMDCLEDCPRNGISFSPDLSLAEWNDYDPGRRQALVTLGVAIVGVALLRSNMFAERENPHLIRPPGTRQNDLLEKCIRCGECVRACPTSAIQPALFEAGLEGLWVPILIHRLGYCDYSCNACGQVCPVQAILPLSLNEKRLQVIGLAYIDQDRCIAWADNRDCIVCEEMCPLPEKAIWLEKAEVLNANGEPVKVQLPHVNRDGCIGCGICEYKCPVNGEAAIRVFVPNADPGV